MMTRKTTAVALATVLGILVLGAPSESRGHESSRFTRARCTVKGSAGDRGRQMGARNGARLVKAAWTKLGQTCDKLDRLAQVISETQLAKPYTGGEFAACFYMAYIDSLWDGLDDAYTRCGDECFEAGAEIGSISANGYCAASIAIDGLLDPGFISQPPLPFCGENLVVGCKVEYIYVAEEAFPGCSAYTEDDYAETFDNFVRQDCFVPEDVPIRDEGEKAWLN